MNARAMVSVLALVALLAGACSFTTSYDPELYWRCGPDGFCPTACKCLDGKVCVPADDASGPEACAWCPEGFVDCDQSVANGCEAEPAHDPRNCGGCGNLCAGNEFCVEGLCLGACVEPYLACGSRCVDPRSDPKNCGGCGNECAPGQVCSRGQCGTSCDQGLSNCSGACVDLASNPAHCGDCGRLCEVANAFPLCFQGACGIAACRGNFANCDGNEQNGCEVDTASDRFNCGSCGKSCGSADTMGECLSGQCACPEGWGNCDDTWENGCETLLEGNLHHCGNCSRDCFVELADKLRESFCTNDGDIQYFEPNCRQGECLPRASIRSCGGECREGLCYGTECNGRLCDPDEACIDGECLCAGEQCDSDETCCGGVCTGMLFDDENCGKCGHACPFGSFCDYGSCQCLEGWQDCNGDLALDSSDGCETDLSQDGDCGGCGNLCPNNSECREVNGGVFDCVCSDGYFDCNGQWASDGCESQLADDANCGGCGNACSPNAHCNPDISHCECDFGWGECNGDLSDGCETFLLSDFHCGACDKVCPFNSHCSPDAAGNETIDCQCLPGYGDCDGDFDNGCESCDPNCNLPQCATDLICCLDPGSGCVDPYWDEANCGGCGNVCRPGFGCTDGICHSPGVLCGDISNVCSEAQTCCFTMQAEFCTSASECLAISGGLLMACDDNIDCSLNGDGQYCCLGSGQFFSACTADCPVSQRLCTNDADCDDGSNTRHFCCPQGFTTPGGTPMTFGHCRTQPC